MTFTDIGLTDTNILRKNRSEGGALHLPSFAFDCVCV